jgi:REP element-mobilizing transposase RayT
VSNPRQIIAGRTYLVTRRCTQRQFLLRPDPQMNEAFLYCLAYASSRTNVGIVAFLAEANHYHAVVIDTDGRLPQFLESFHKLLAKCGNAIRRRWENFFSNDQTSVVALLEPEDVFAKMVYTLSNPVKDHLVERAHHWPGASSRSANLSGKVFEAERPRSFFRPNGSMPERLTLACVRPPGFEQMSDHDLRDRLATALAQVEADAAAERLATGRRILGRKAVLAQSPTARPSSSAPRRQLDPAVAAKSKWQRIEALVRLKEFRAAYRAARERWLAGMDVVFPTGTWWLRRFAAVPCEELCTDESPLAVQSG